jgi:hypothetical protein
MKASRESGLEEARGVPKRPRHLALSDANLALSSGYSRTLEYDKLASSSSGE